MLQYVQQLFATRGSAAFLGLCFPQAWMYLISSGLVCSDTGFQLSFHIGMLVCLAVLALVALRGQPSWPLAADAVFAIAMACVPLAGFALSGTFDIALAVIGVLGGAGVGWCFAAWLCALSSLPVRSSFCFVLLGFSLGAAGCLAFKLLSDVLPAAVLVVGTLLPFASMGTLRFCLRTRGLKGAFYSVGRRGGDEEGSSLGRIVVLILQVALYSLVFGNGFVFSVLQDSIPASPHNTGIVLLNYGLRIALPLVLMAWLAVQSGSGADIYRPVFKVLMLIVVFLLLGAWYIGGLDALISYALVSTARNMVLMLLFLACLRLVAASGKSPWFIFGVGRGVYEASVIAGIAGYTWLMRTLGPIEIGEDLVYLTALCVLVFLTSCFFATAQSLGSPAGCEGSDGNLPAEKDVPVEDPHAALRARYALNDREFEILMLFCHGNSKRRIAEQLGLSENTVRWYLQQLYARMDVHSRDELLELVDTSDTVLPGCG